MWRIDDTPARTPNSRYAQRMLTRPAVVAAALLTLATGCGGSAPAASDEGSSASASAGSQVDDTASSESEGPDDSADADEPGAGEGPEESFRAWLAASREPDADTACGYLTPELVHRMVAEMKRDGWPDIDDCASMTEATAALFAAAGSSAEVDLEVEEQTARRAVLAVRYRDTGKCGSAVMRPDAGHWVITEQSEQRC